VSASERSSRRPPGPALLLGLALARGLLYAAITPPWQAPDETGHFEYAWQIARSGLRFATVEARPEFEQELVASLYAWRYGDFIGRPLPDQMPDRLEGLPSGVFARLSRTFPARFSLAYVWQALFLLPVSHEDLVTQLYIARLSSVILNVAIVGMAWKIFREMGLPVDWAAAATAFLVFWPQHTFINAAINEGPLAELCAAAVLWGWVRLLQRGLSLGGMVAVIGGMLLGLWAKNTAAILVPLNLLSAILWVGSKLLRRRRPLWEWLVYSSGAATVCCAAVILSAWTPAGRWLRLQLEQVVDISGSAPVPVLSATDALAMTAESL